jgi:ubiquinol-cytochrome c reductase cytochrome b subunit
MILDWMLRPREKVKAVKDVITERLGLRRIRENLLERRVPQTPWYQGDGASMIFLIGVLTVTGLFMTPSYSNTPDHAYKSVVHITEVLHLGWFVRALHYWSAGTLMVMLIFHLFRQILIGGYKAPREGTWTVGVILFLLIIIMSFSGYVLRWDERAIYAVRVALHMFYYVPWIGEYLVLFVQGGPEIGTNTLTRFFALHVIFIPLLLFGLLAYHLYLVILHGVTSISEREVPIESAEHQKHLYKKDAHSEKGEWFHPATMANNAIFAGLIFCIPLTLALTLGPAPLYPEANLTEVSAPIEEWWFAWYSSLIALVPPEQSRAFLVAFPATAFLFLFALPFLDRSQSRGIQNRPIWAVSVTVAALALLALGALRWQSPWTGWPDPTPPPMPAGVVLPPNIEEGRQLFARYGCNSCHGVAGKGRVVGPDFAKLRPMRSLQELREFTLRPPPGVAMPAYAGRMSAEELERVVEFCHFAQTLPLNQ